MILELSDIIDLSYLQAMLDIFSKDLQSTDIEIASAILNEDAKPIVYETGFGKFCNTIRETAAGEHQCRLSDLKAISSAKESFKKGAPKTIYHICNMGLLDFCAPLSVGDDIVGYFFGGQLRVKDGFKYENELLKTFDSPDLKDLVHDLNSDNMKYDSVNDYTDSLKKIFAEIKVLQVTDLDRIKLAVDAMVQLLNSMVRELHESHHVEQVDEFMKGIEKKNVQNIDDLFKFVVDKLPPLVDAKFCSIFTVHRGYPENEDCLVLRKTSYQSHNDELEENKLEENSSFYKKDEKENHLTAWVWANAKPLLLKDITNADELRSYNINRIKGKYNDSDEHRGFLAMPIIGYNNQVIGVIRLPHKIRREGREIDFTNHDAIFLEFLAHNLAPVIERQELLDQFERTKGLVNAAQELAHASSYDEVLRLMAEHAALLFGGGAGKKYFINRYRPGSQYWTMKKTAGALVLDGDLENRKFSITEGLTGRIIRDEKMQPVLLHDLKTAQMDGEYIEAVPDGKSAMAAPLKHGEEIYGVIGIVSNKKFIFSEKDREILAILAKISGDAIVRTRWFALRELIKRILDIIPLLARYT